MNDHNSDARTPTSVFIFFCGVIVGGILLWGLIPNDVLVTQEMALTALEKRCEPGDAWEYRTPNPKTDETVLIVQCNPSDSS